MKISVKKAQNGVYALTIGEAVHTLGASDFKRLLLEAVKALAPGALPELTAQEEAVEFAQRLKTADQAGLQKFIINARDADLAAFIKATEDDSELRDVIFANMSERKHKMLDEDLEFRFPEGEVPDEELEDAVIRLIDLVNHLHADGQMTLGDGTDPSQGDLASDT